VLLHSDRGSQYTAHDMAVACGEHGLRRSMGATGICWDNASAESLLSSFKHEHSYRHVYATKTELIAAVDNWMTFYNHERRHSAIGMRAPTHQLRALAESHPGSKLTVSTFSGDPRAAPQPSPDTPQRGGELCKKGEQLRDGNT
jgi:transposase InsO family protein